MAYLMTASAPALAAIWAAGPLSPETDGPENVRRTGTRPARIPRPHRRVCLRSKASDGLTEQPTPMPTSRSSTTRASRRWSATSVQRWRTRTVPPTT